LGLRELGIDKEFGMSSVTVPRALFFGRRRRAALAGGDGKTDQPDYPPPPLVVPLTAATYKLHTPALLHAFYAQRIEAGGIDKDDAFDAVHATIGALGQIIVKPLPGAAPPKKPGVKKEANGEEKAKKKKQTGVGKGNWIRPSKEERDRRAAEKKALLEKQKAEQGQEKEEDAEGEQDGQ
jgi:transcriptional activator SPT7